MVRGGLGGELTWESLVPLAPPAPAPPPPLGPGARDHLEQRSIHLWMRVPIAEVVDLLLLLHSAFGAGLVGELLPALLRGSAILELQQHLGHLDEDMVRRLIAGLAARIVRVEVREVPAVAAAQVVAAEETFALVVAGRIAGLLAEVLPGRTFEGSRRHG